MVLCGVFGPVVSDIPMAAPAAVMVMVSFATFDWHSLAPRTLNGSARTTGRGRHASTPCPALERGRTPLAAPSPWSGLMNADGCW